MALILMQCTYKFADARLITRPFRMLCNKLGVSQGFKRDEVTGEWRKLHDEECHNLYSSSDIIRQIKSKRMRWEGHVARMGEGRNVDRVLVGKPEGKDTT
jgi:hypothetical protein